MGRRPPAQIRNRTGSNKNVKKEEAKALELTKAMDTGAFSLFFPSSLSAETVKEFTSLYDALCSINILSQSDKIIFMQAAKTFDLLLALDKEYQDSTEPHSRMMLIDKMDKLRRTLYTLLSKFFVTPEDRFRAALAIAHGDKKRTAITRIIDDE